jgi:hypothetical protein
MVKNNIQVSSIVKDNKTGEKFQVISVLGYCNAYMGVRYKDGVAATCPVIHLKKGFISLAT